jgi:hypothetical protein
MFRGLEGFIPVSSTNPQYKNILFTQPHTEVGLSRINGDYTLYDAEGNRVIGKSTNNISTLTDDNLQYLTMVREAEIIKNRMLQQQQFASLQPEPPTGLQLKREVSDVIRFQSEKTCTLHSAARIWSRYIKLLFPESFPASYTEKMSDLYDMRDSDTAKNRFTEKVIRARMKSEDILSLEYEVLSFALYNYLYMLAEEIHGVNGGWTYETIRTVYRELKKPPRNIKTIEIMLGFNNVDHLLSQIAQGTSFEERKTFKDGLSTCIRTLQSGLISVGSILVTANYQPIFMSWSGSSSLRNQYLVLNGSSTATLDAVEIANGDAVPWDDDLFTFVMKKGYYAGVDIKWPEGYNLIGGHAKTIHLKGGRYFIKDTLSYMLNPLGLPYKPFVETTLAEQKRESTTELHLVFPRSAYYEFLREHTKKTPSPKAAAMPPPAPSVAKKNYKDMELEEDEEWRQKQMTALKMIGSPSSRKAYKPTKAQQEEVAKWLNDLDEEDSSSEVTISDAAKAQPPNNDYKIIGLRNVIDRMKKGVRYINSIEYESLTDEIDEYHYYYIDSGPNPGYYSYDSLEFDLYDCNWHKHIFLANKLMEHKVSFIKCRYPCQNYQGDFDFSENGYSYFEDGKNGPGYYRTSKNGGMRRKTRRLSKKTKRSAKTARSKK